VSETYRSCLFKLPILVS